MTRMSDQLGRVLSGRYRLVAPIGAGASALVFLADDTRLRRRVAIKILHAGLAADETFLRRFRTEAQAAAALNHPHVLAVYDWGDDDGTVYLVTEYLDGGSLRAMLDDGGRLTPSQALMIGLEAARGLDFAHRRGFVHRDIKPANLLFDADGRLRVADFGLARALAEAAWTEPAGAVVGTARYASPEQARGEKVDGRSDIYSLALVLIEAVTGRVPFAADTTIATLMARVDAAVEVPSELGELRPVLARAGRPVPDDRPDAGEFALGLLAAAEELARPEPLPLVGAIVGDGKGFDNDPTLLPEGTTTKVATTTAAGPGAASAPYAGDAEATATATDTATATTVVDLDEVVEEIDPAEVEGLPGATRRERRQAGKARRRADRVAEAEARRRARDARGRPWRKVLLAVLVVAVLAAAGGLAYTQLYTPSHDVPELIGQSEADATARADELGWEVRRLEDRLDGSDPGDVIFQNPEPGTRLREGETISLTISLGATLADVPADLVNRPAADVEAALVAAGFSVGDATRAFDEEVATENVISLAVDGVTPLPARLPRGTVVDLTVSQGPTPRSIPAVPAGATFELYAAALQQERLQVTRGDEFSATVPANQIISVTPIPGTEVPRDSAVAVVVSRGPAVVVPNVIGQPLAQAIAALQQVGLVIVETSGNGGVLSTDPPPGAQVPLGTGIRVFASA
ncbi:MAG: protein kinase domain-containing protein [Acidimicrobiales bacterium]